MTKKQFDVKKIMDKKNKTLVLYIEADPAAPEFLKELDKRATQCVAANLTFDYKTGVTIRICLNYHVPDKKRKGLAWPLNTGVKLRETEKEVIRILAESRVIQTEAQLIELRAIKKWDEQDNGKPEPSLIVIGPMANINGLEADPIGLNKAILEQSEPEGHA